MNEIVKRLKTAVAQTAVNPFVSALLRGAAGDAVSLLHSQQQDIDQLLRNGVDNASLIQKLLDRVSTLEKSAHGKST